ncbi:MAG TPA: hypothetical protein PLJ60_08895 [Chryseolinea sp.]|nr:hypothetical protein [Chryseolinea sp.]HPM30443.1 hypothetical protein [Chryseolinea sp.]
MKNVLVLLICLLASPCLFAQNTNDDVVEIPSTLKERYIYMKSKAQTFKDYKVIKESVLDGVWKISQDSLRAKQSTIVNLNDSLKKLNGTLQQTTATIKEKDESLAEMTHAGTHVTFIGIDVLKSVFITIAISIAAGLILFVVILIGRLKLMAFNLKQKTDALDSTQNDFQEYKHKAMEKQTKLSRELQDERNKLQSQRSS